MLHVYKYVLNDYIDNADKRTLLQGNKEEDFDLPFNLLDIDIHAQDDYAFIYACRRGNIHIAEFY
jgi:hypothetical protein